MLSIILFILILAAFSVFAAARLGKSFCETMPISAMGIILVLFVFGLFNSLGVGVIVICAISVFLYGYICYWIVKNGGVAKLEDTISKLFTSGTMLFVLLVGLIAYWNKGRYATLTDEFSHWLDIVFIMAGSNKFGAVQGSGAVFPSYPPAMSLFQYLLEKINMTVNAGEISEWKAYFAYQIFAVIIMLPFFRKEGEKNAVNIASGILWFIAIVTPLYFFSQALYSLYIDPALGIMGGCGFAMVALSKKKDWLYITYMIMLMAVLTLSKDVGIYLSIFISLFFAIDWISIHVKDVKNQAVSGKIKQLIIALAPMISMIAAKMLWKLELTIAHTEIKFGAPFDIAGTIATIKGEGTEFNTSVYNHFLDAITNRLIFFERVGINYTAMMVLLIVLFIVFMTKLYRVRRITKATCISGIILPGCAVVFYILSMFPLYISRFNPEEALNLASFDRYCGIVFLTGTLFAVWLLQDYICQIKNTKWMLVVLVLAVLAVYHSQQDTVTQYVTKTTVEYSQQYREAVNILSANINANTEEGANILLVGFDEDQPMHPILETISKPRHFAFSDLYIADTCDEENKVASADELQDIIKNNYDYVAVYRPTDNLVENYSQVFADSQDIKILSLYVVDADGKLRLLQ